MSSEQNPAYDLLSPSSLTLLINLQRRPDNPSLA
ncbi:Conserved hypothetical protein [Prochlorococcus marinus str. MIT 9303]|uniref:Uncharacterized protein n=1 Tax=Prochlorococcus marinus (strain MIT 9303) TaxID=59922 RepID=A2CCW9_PROM3|nr:Conserved hypothetical protein [Prochlorococcus marinus str. MIT 9303]